MGGEARWPEPDHFLIILVSCVLQAAVGLNALAHPVGCTDIKNPVVIERNATDTEQLVHGVLLDSKMRK